MFNLVAEGTRNFYTEPAGGRLHGDVTVPRLPRRCVGQKCHESSEQRQLRQA